MAKLYQSGASLKDVGHRYGFSATGVLKALRRIGLVTRTRKDVGPIQGAKRRGGAHYTKRNPPAFNPNHYKSIRVIDEDGKIHRRREHVVRMERFIGRRLLPDECVHHKDGNKRNNDLDNLELMTRHDHAVYEMKLVRRTHPEKFIRRIDPATGRFLK